jgi:hypothetical protein
MFAKSVPLDKELLKAIALNGERILGILKTDRLSPEELEAKIHSYLIEAPLFLDFGHTFDARAGYSEDVYNRAVFFPVGVSDLVNITRDKLPIARYSMISHEGHFRSQYDCRSRNLWLRKNYTWPQYHGCFAMSTHICFWEIF